MRVIPADTVATEAVVDPAIMVVGAAVVGALVVVVVVVVVVGALIVVVVPHMGHFPSMASLYAVHATHS
jgi:hypothetical protein